MRARDNPFATDRVLRIRYRLQGPSWDQLLENLRALNLRAAIIGPDGTGKTTLLEDLEPRLAALGFTVKNLRLDDRDRRFSRGFLRRFIETLTSGDVILFDGADLMAPLGWQWFKHRTARAAGLIITSHRQGLLPALIECGTTRELAEEIVRELVGGEKSESLRDSVCCLYEKHRGNLRGVLRDLYDVFAERQAARAKFEESS